MMGMFNVMTTRRCPNTMFLPLVLILAVFAFWNQHLLADVIHFKDGKTLEGKVLKEGKDKIQFKTRFGTVEIERERVKKIEYKESPEEAFKKMVNELDRKNPDAIFDLAMWCKENRKKKEYQKYLEETLKADPQHDGANRELGNIQYDGKWYTADGLERYKKEKEARMKTRGWIFHEGEWMPEAEARREMGYVEYEGKWISQMEAYHKRAERDIPETFGFSMTITDSEHFTIRSKQSEAFHQELLDYCELEFEHFIRIFKPDEIELKIMSYYPIPIYIFDDIDDVVTFVDSKYVLRYNPPKGKTEKYRNHSNFSIYFPRPLVVLTYGRHLVGHEDKTTSQIGFMSHHIGHILIRRFKRGGKVPGWVEAGVAHYYEGLTNYHQTVSVCEYIGFEDVEKWIQGWGNFMEWKKQITRASTHDQLPSVKDLFKKQIETMNSHEMAKSWSLVTYLIKNYKEQFVTFCRRSYAPYRGEKELSQAAAWKLAFPDKTPEQMESEWRSWIVEQPIAPSREDRLKLDDEEGKGVDERIFK